MEFGGNGRNLVLAEMQRKADKKETMPEEEEGKKREKRKEGKKNSRKSVRWSAVPVPCLSRLCLKLRGEQGSGPKGVDDLCFRTYG